MKKIKILVFSLIAFLCFGAINVSAINTDISTRFGLILNEDGKIELNAIKATSHDELSGYLEDHFDKYRGEGYRFGLRYCNEDDSVCFIDLYPPFMSGERTETHEIEIIYKDNNNDDNDDIIKEKINHYIENISEIKLFLVNDLDAVNFWVNGCSFEDFDKCLRQNLSNYSSELKNFFENYNIDYNIAFATLAEDAGLFYRRYGETVFKYNDVAYGAKSNIGVQLSNIIYVPSDTETNKETLMQTAQTRINEYLGSETAVVLSYGGLCSSLDYSTSILAYLNLSGTEHYFIATVGEDEYRILIVPDSAKMLNQSVFTRDLITGVEVRTSSNIPLDAMLSVSKITSGEEYDKIMKILNVTNSEMFDLNLFSKSINNYITKLENGSFEVRIPISEAFIDKDLTVFYIDENDIKHEYPVTIDGDYAVFNTNHFSIYTLAETNKINEENPNTGDSIMNSIIMGSISFICLLGISIYIKKKKFNNV